MKARAGCILILAVSTLTSLQTHATTANAGNPYEKIFARNAFGLKDLPAPEAIVAPKDPPPKITLQGLTRVLEREQVLFKVAMPARPSQPAAEVSKILSEGERDGDIEVLEIDMDAGVIKFSNHGVTETKTMKDDAAKPSPGSLVMAPQPAASTPQPMPLGGGGAVAPAPAVNTGGGGSSLTTIGSARAAGLQQIPTRNVRNSYGPSGSSGNSYGSYGAGQQLNGGGGSQSLEESIIKVELEREINKDAISSGRYPPPPPTPLSPQPKSSPQ